MATTREKPLAKIVRQGASTPRVDTANRNRPAFIVDRSFGRQPGVQSSSVQSIGQDRLSFVRDQCADYETNRLSNPCSISSSSCLFSKQSPIPSICKAHDPFRAWPDIKATIVGHCRLGTWCVEGPMFRWTLSRQRGVSSSVMLMDVARPLPTPWDWCSAGPYRKSRGAMPTMRLNCWAK